MDSSICQMHTICVDHFSVLVNALQETIPKDTTLASRREAIEDAMDKYNMWAGNLGAGHFGPEYKKSLDYRLREASVYKLQVLSLMKDLQIVLERALVLTRSVLLVDDTSSVSNSEASGTIGAGEEEEEDSPWEVSSDSEGEVSPKQQQALPADTLSDAKITIEARAQAKPQQQPSTHESVGYIVQCLWRLPLRRPVPLDRMGDRTAADTSYYQPFDTMYVRDKFPNIDEGIAIRFGKMISRRRQLIRYRKSHTEALQERLAEKSALIARRTRELHTRSGFVDNVSELAPSFDAPSRGTHDTKATTLKPTNSVMDADQIRGFCAPSVSDFRSSVASEQTGKDTPMRIPRRPIGEDGKSREQFICPYCSTAQLITSDRKWKKHVLADLQTYVCTFPDCQLHEYVFESRDDWFQHELQHHRYEWFCNEEHHESFHELPDFLEHMEKAHQNSLNKSQVQTLWRSFQRPSRSQSGDCSLCGKHSTQLKCHLSRHLEQLSLFAIRQTDYMADMDGDDAQSKVARRNLDAVTISALSSHDLDDSIEAPTLDIDINTNEKQQETQTESPLIDEHAATDPSEHFEDSVDTSWGSITLKLQKAREAIHAVQAQTSSKNRVESTSMQYDYHPFYERPVCGASIAAYRNGKHLPPCTLGGIILVDGKPYGMTVQHFLEGPENKKHNKIELGKSLSERQLLFSKDLIPNVEDVFSQNEGGILVTQPALGDWHDDFYSQNNKDQDHLDACTLGRIYATSESWNRHKGMVNEMDWALIEIYPERLQLYNVVQGGKMFCKEQQPEAVVGTEHPLQDQYLTMHTSDPHEYPTEVADSSNLGDRKVHWFSRTSRLQSGVIKSRRSKTWRSQKGVLQQTLPFEEFDKIIEGDCARKGDAGAWVIDDDSRVCGYIVSSDVRSNTTYVCPMEVAVENIKITLRANNVCLPGLGTFLPDTSVEASTDLNTAEVENAANSQPIEVEETTNTQSVNTDDLQLREKYDVLQWYCSECRDGPYLKWQVSCQNCQHPKCSSCPSVPRDIQEKDRKTAWWYCSKCNEGPYGGWQSSCQNCQHSKCSSCQEIKG